MNILGDFFLKYKNLIEGGQKTKDKIVAEIAMVAKITINPSQISLKNGVIYILKANSSQKAEIYINKKRILDQLKKKLPEEIFADIR